MAAAFIRRFLLHILPSGFVKIRHFGFLSNRNRTALVQLCRELLPPSAVTPPLIEHHEPLCPVCKIGHLHVIEWQPALQWLSSPALHCQSPALDSSKVTIAVWALVTLFLIAKVGRSTHWANVPALLAVFSIPFAITVGVYKLMTRTLM